MKRVLLISALAAIILGSCGQKKGQTEAVTADAAPAIAISELVSNPVEYGDQIVRIEGVIDHMCRHSGDKMRVKESGSDLSIEVKLGEMASEFSVELEGRSVALEGKLQYLVGNKDELGEEAAAHQQAEGEEHSCESEKAAAEALKARGIDPSISAFITLAKYELK